MGGRTEHSMFFIEPIGKKTSRHQNGMTLNDLGNRTGELHRETSDKTIFYEKVSFSLSLEIEIPGLPLEEIPEDRPDDHHNSKVDDLLLGRGDEGPQDIGGNEKFQPENNFTGEFIPYLVVNVITLPKFQKEYFDGSLKSAIDDEDFSGNSKNASYNREEIKEYRYIH